MIQSLAKQSYFVIGTDTGVGKTYFSHRLIKHFVAQGCKTIGMKPIASGFDQLPNGEWENEDVAQLCAASNVTAPMQFINPYAFKPAIAPHIAAAEAGVSIEIASICSAYHALTSRAELVVVEGAGGLMVPLNHEQTLLDLVKALELPVILVVGMRLGCINHALLTMQVLETHGVVVAGWVANQIDPEMSRYQENLTTLQSLINLPLLDRLQWQPNACL